MRRRSSWPHRRRAEKNITSRIAGQRSTEPEKWAAALPSRRELQHFASNFPLLRDGVIRTLLPEYVDPTTGQCFAELRTGDSASSSAEEQETEEESVEGEGEGDDSETSDSASSTSSSTSSSRLRSRKFSSIHALLNAASPGQSEERSRVASGRERGYRYRVDAACIHGALLLSQPADPSKLGSLRGRRATIAARAQRTLRTRPNNAVKLHSSSDEEDDVPQADQEYPGREKPDHAFVRIVAFERSSEGRWLRFYLDFGDGAEPFDAQVGGSAARTGEGRKRAACYIGVSFDPDAERDSTSVPHA